MPVTEIPNKMKITSKDIILVVLSIVIVCLCFAIIIFTAKSHKDLDFKYAVVIDCGSSGSRVHVFKYKIVEGSKYLPLVERVTHEDEAVVRKTDIPLSDFEKSAQNAADYLNNLMSQVQEFIPEEKWKKTHLYVFATAGMRYLSDAKQKEFIENLKIHLMAKSKFLLTKIKIISGKKEGVFAWVSFNYFAKNFQKNCGETVNVIEMGGASTQVAFETLKNNLGTEKFTYFCKRNGQMVTHNVYAVTFLGLGVNKALKHFREDVFNNVEDPLKDSCLANKCTEIYETKNYEGTGEAGVCYNKVKDVFQRYFTTTEAIQDDFKDMESRIRVEHAYQPRNIYALGSFSHAFLDFIHYSGPLDPGLYWSRNVEFCRETCDIHKKNMEKNLYNTKSVKYLNIQCFRLPYMRYILEQFFPFVGNPPLISRDTDHGLEIDYTLGALVYSLSQA